MSCPDNAVIIYDGDLEFGTWVIVDDYIAKSLSVLILKSDIIACNVISDVHQVSHTRSGRIAGGILGAVLLGPLGAAAGLMTGGQTKVDETKIYCALRDGRTFSAEVSPATSAKIQQICQLNQINTHQNVNLQTTTVDVNIPTTSSSGDYIECPMCAESIKSRAKVCRFCGYNILIEKDLKISALISDPCIEYVLNYHEQLKMYRDNISYEDENISNELVHKIVLEFSNVISSNPNADYRELSMMVKNKLSISKIKYINDLTRESFKFIRECKKFDVYDDSLAIRK